MNRIQWFKRNIIDHEYAGVFLLVLFSLILHFATITQPAFPAFDEHYYVPAARTILDGSGSDITEHPPLGQLIIAAGIRVFGDNPVGWRFFSIIFGTVSIFLFFLICRQLGMSRSSSFLATFLLSIENLSFVLASVAMLDVYCVTFMLLSFWLYLKGKPVGSGLAVGLATLAKLSGALALLVILLHWIFTRRRDKWALPGMLITAAVSFLALMPILDFAIWHAWLNPITQLNALLTQTKHATFALYTVIPSGTTPTRPWYWLTHLDSIATLTFDQKLFQFHVLYYLMISPFIWALIIPSMIYTAYRAFKRSKPAIFIFCWFAGTYLVWIPLSLVSDRISYVYYFYPTIGAICAGIALGLTGLAGLKPKWPLLRRLLSLLTPLYLIICLVFFMTLSLGSIWLKVFLSILFYMTVRYYAQRTDEPVIPQPVPDNEFQISTKM